MQNLKLIVVLLALTVTLPFVCANPQETPECTRGLDISCIQSFHEAIAPSCHKYMPKKDYATVRQHVPNMLAEAERIAEFKLDSTYASISDEFDEKRYAFLSAVLELKAAADTTDDDKLKKAFDKMHMAFAEMASVLALMPAEVEAFHEILAQVWHEYLPSKNYEAIRSAIPGMRESCAKMKAAKLHEAKQSVSKEYLAAVDKIEASIGEIEKALASNTDEKIAAAVTGLHDGFRELAGLF